MAFNYDDDLLTDRDVIRFQIGDTVVSPSGAKPEGGNFSDAEIAGILTLEGTANRAIARLYENLATLWGNYVDTKIGPRDEKLSQVAANYRLLAKQWRDTYGSSGSDIFLGYFNEGLDEAEDE